MTDFTIIQFKELSALGAEAYYLPHFIAEYNELWKKTLSVSFSSQIVDTIASYALPTSFFNEVMTEYPFHQEKTHMRLGGILKTFDQPRLTRFMGDDSKAYTYAGEARPAVAWTPSVLELRTMLMHVVRQLRPTHPIFNTVLGNLYADGTKYIAKHSDAETDLCSDAFIASLSLGAVRDFDLWDKKAKKRILRVALADGSLFIMGRNFQKKLQHDLPKRLRVKHARVNLTFRMIKE